MPAKTLDELIVAISQGKISHTRFRSWCRVGVVYVYERDLTSPTGVQLWGSFDEDTPGLDVILKGGLSPLSPTEKL